MKEVKQTITKIEAVYDLCGISHEEMMVIVSALKGVKDYKQRFAMMNQCDISEDDKEEIQEANKVLEEITKVCKGVIN